MFLTLRRVGMVIHHEREHAQDERIIIIRLIADTQRLERMCHRNRVSFMMFHGKRQTARQKTQEDEKKNGNEQTNNHEP